MHITILTIGSRGDVQPLTALGVGLQRAGHRVRCATHREFAPLVAEQGLEFAPIDANPRALLDSDAGRAWIAAGRNPITFMRGFTRLAAPLLASVLDAAWQACQSTDAIIYNALGASFTFAGLHVAEKLGVPYVGAVLWPHSRTRAFPAIMLPTGGHSLGPLNKPSHLVAEQLFWQPFRRGVNRWRRDHLALPPLPVFGPYRHLQQAHVPVLCGYSPMVVPPPADWPAWHPITGYWFLNRPTSWQPPTDLRDFLAAGPPPVYIGFGSMTVRSQEEHTALIVQALKHAGQRGILAAGWSGVGHGAASDDVFVVTEVPHDWLFPQMAAVVIHGGAGTTAAALRAGVPTVVAPFYGDQPFWGQRIAALGVGPPPLPQHELSVARLAATIRRVTTDATMQARAGEVGHHIRAEDGVARAVAAFDRFVAA